MSDKAPLPMDKQGSENSGVYTGDILGIVTKPCDECAKWKALAGEFAATIRILDDMFSEVKDGELNGKYVLNRHRFLVENAAAKAREAGL